MAIAEDQLLDDEQELDENEETDDEESEQESENEETDEEGNPLESEVKSIDVIAKDKEQLAKLAEESEDLRQEVEALRTSSDKKAEKLTTLIPNPIIHPDSRSPLYSMPEEEWLDIIQVPWDNEELKAQAIKERKQYIKHVKPILEEQNALNTQSQALWYKEWDLVTNEYLATFPEFKKYLPNIKAKLEQELKESPARAARLDSGLEPKVKWVAKALKELGLDKKIVGKKAMATSEERPGKAQPKGKSSSATGTSSNKTFTRAQIASMSAEEYDKNEAAIDKAWKAGKIK